MKKDEIYIFITNFLIMLPSISMFVYDLPKEYHYWDYLWYIFFILPVLKYISPTRIRRLIYPLSIIIILSYVLLSELILIFRVSFFLSHYFHVDFSSQNLTVISYTISSAVAFPFIVEGMMAKTPQGTIGYLIASSTSTIYFITALYLVTLFHDSLSSNAFFYSYNITGYLIFYNLYLLASQGHEFITLLIRPSPFIENLLTVTFMVSIIGLIARLYLQNQEINRQPLENMAYPIFYGSIIALAVTLLLGKLSFTYYGILLMALFLIGTVVIARHGNKKDNYEIGDME